MLSEVYGGEAMERSSVFVWDEWLKEGHENMEDDEISGCPRSQRTYQNAENAEAGAFR